MLLQLIDNAYHNVLYDTPSQRIVEAKLWITSLCPVRVRWDDPCVDNEDRQ